MQLVFTRTIESIEHRQMYVVHMQLVMSDAEREEIARYHLYPMIQYMQDAKPRLHGEWDSSASFIHGTRSAFVDMRDAEQFMEEVSHAFSEQMIPYLQRARSFSGTTTIELPID